MSLSPRRVMLAALAATALAAHAADAEMVDASLLSLVPENYDGKRVQTELSLLQPVAGNPKAMGCEKDDLALMMGPKLEPGKPPAMLKGTWIMCLAKANASQIASANMGAGVTVTGLVEVKGPKGAPRINLKEVQIIEIKALDLTPP